VRIASIKIRNWECYRGEHLLDLEAKTYAIVAQRADNPDASNWAGKSSLLRAIEFGLYGRHIHSTAGGWISRGETAGEVVLRFDNGARITRSRSGSGATKVWWYPASGGEAAMGEAAEAEIVRAIGLSSEDFRASSYFEQRAMGRLVLMRASERMDIVSGWLRLGPLQAAEKAESDALSTLVERVEKLERALTIQMELRARSLASANAKESAELAGDLASCEVDLVVAQEKYDAARAAIDANEAAWRLEAARCELGKLNVDGKLLAEDIADCDAENITERAVRLRHDAAKLAADVSAASALVHKRRAVASGQFDGRCPVAEMECPARAQINARRTENRALLDAAEKDRERLEEARRVAASDASDAERDAQDLERRRARLESMRERAGTLQDQIDAALDAGIGISVAREPLQAALDAAQNEVVDLRTERDAIRRVISEIARADAEIARLQTALAAERAEVELSRACLAVIGKHGIQRRLAEGALGEIEALANDMLADAGVGLSVSVRWSREGSGLATSCDACGLAFPTSAKVKACTRCNAARGPNLVNKLEIELSNRSGAAEDLAGGAVQLAASAWLREDRSSAWSVALIDEPFGALDRFHRRAFATHLAGFLSRRYAIEQAFVISHSPDTVEMLPGRIEVVSDGKWARARVVA
jgi:DNA repair exonuclease SbcCD ATPase subunit